MRISKYGFGLALSLAAAPAMAVPLTFSGDYIRIGISDYGTFGSNGGNDPAFVHDPTGTGSFDPNFDYIAPGIPHDGFSLVSDQFGFTQNDNAGSSDFGFLSPSLLVGPAAMGFDNAATWTGSTSFVSITNSYFYNDGDERVLVTTSITALADLSNLAFARSVDPDSDSRSHGTADTNNQRGNSIFGIDDFVGSAGAVSGLTLALINIDDAGFEHTTSIQSNCCSNINPYDVLSHGGGDQGLASFGDHGLNLAYLIGELSEGSTVTLTYAYAVGEKIDDVGGPEGVPEPSTWALMMGGFALVGSAMRRRKVAVSFA